MSGVHRPVRILPMGDDPEFEEPTRKWVQDKYFLEKLPAKKGIYEFRETALIAGRGTIVLFQYQKRVIASAVLAEPRTRYPMRTPEGYCGHYRFLPDSIKVFDPVDAEVMKTVWPTDFRRFSQGKPNLTAERYSEFESRLTNVRTPELAADDAENVEDDDYIPRSGDERPIIIKQQIRARRGGRKFREGLLARFNDTCLVTGCRVKDLLEAAHICPHRGAKDDHLQNGLLLRSDIHTLFDLHLLAIEPEQLRVEIHPKLKEDEYYRDLDGKLLTVTGEARPSLASLREHYGRFQRRTAIG